MIVKYFLIFIATFIIISCSTTDEMPNDLVNETPSEMVDVTNEMPDNFTKEVPDDVEIDINDDGIIDFVIDYGLWIIDPLDPNDGGNAIYGSIESNNNNQVLDNKGEESLFLRELEDIKESVDEPLIWSTSRTIIWIHDNLDGQWPNEWEISSNSVHSTYFLGLKIINNNVTQLGWVELDIDTSNGDIEVIDKGIL